MRRAKFVQILVFLGGYGVSCLSPPGKAQDAEAFRITVDVKLVVLHAIVRDGKGHIVSDLCEENFDVYEDGVRQSIRLFAHEDTPVAAGLVVDHSRSMRPKLAQVIVAARAFVQYSNPQDQMFVINFNEKASLGLPEGTPFTSRSSDLEVAIANAPAAGMTALYDAVVAGIKQLQAGARNKKVLVVISDGSDNVSAHGRDDVLELAEKSGTIIYTIGLFDAADPDRNPKVLKRLARETGGEAYFPGERGALAPICRNIAHDIRNQYTLGYVSTNVAANGAYRSIRVAAEAEAHGKLFVRTRAGYAAAGGSRPGKGQEAP